MTWSRCRIFRVLPIVFLIGTASTIAASHGAPGKTLEWTEAYPQPGLQEDPPSPFDAALRNLRDAVDVHRDGRHLGNLRALRELGEPSLQQLFMALLEHRKNELIRIHAIVGLAELSDEQRVDIEQIRSLPTGRGQFTAVQESLRLELLDREQMLAMLGWDDLEAPARVAILAELERQAPPSAELLEQARQLATHDDLSIATLASCILLQHGDGAAFDAVRERIAERDDNVQLQAEMWICEDAARYDFDQLTAWISSIVQRDAADANLLHAASVAMLSLDAPAGLAFWQQAMAHMNSPVDRIEQGTILLRFIDDVEIPDAHFEGVRNDIPISNIIADLGLAFHGTGDLVEATKAAVVQPHYPLALRAIELAERLAEADRTVVYEHAIQGFDASVTRNRAQRADIAMRAVMALAAIDPALVQSIADNTDDDDPIRELLLIGLLNADRDEAYAEIARAVRTKSAGRANALAALVIGRHAETLTSEEVVAVGRVARGGTRVTAGHEVQAAWLYFDATGRIDEALQSVMGAGE